MPRRSSFKFALTTCSLGLLGLAATLSLASGCSSSESETVDTHIQAAVVAVGGSCLHPALDFEDPSRWSIEGGMISLGDAHRGEFKLELRSPTTAIAKISPFGSTFTRQAQVRLQHQGPGELTLVAGGVSGTPVVLGSQDIEGSSNGEYALVTFPISEAQAAGFRREPHAIEVRIEANFAEPAFIDSMVLGETICEQNIDVADGAVLGSVVEDATSSVDFSVRLPKSRSIFDTAIGTSDLLKINDGTDVYASTQDSYSALANSGPTTNIGVGAVTGGIVVAGSIHLRGSTVWGDVIYGGFGQEDPIADVHGSFSRASVQWETAESWSAIVTPGAEAVRLEANAGLRPLVPGAYDTLYVGSNSRVSLAPGTYVFRAVNVEPGGAFELDNAAGDYQIYVQQSVSYKGRIQVTDPTHNNVLFAVLGDDFYVARPFFGTIVAPNAFVNVDMQGNVFRGAIYARSAEVHQNSSFYHLPYQPISCVPDFAHPCGSSRLGCAALEGCVEPSANVCEEPYRGLGLPAVQYAMTGQTPEEPIWGFADLHAHPATHLGFGARIKDGEEVPGLFHGDPLGELESCDPAKHDGDGGFPVHDKTQETLVQTLDGIAGAVHTPRGPGQWSSWPSAQSVSHQQMHVEWVKRAHRGGLRLMFASVADTQLLHELWNMEFQRDGSGLFNGLQTIVSNPDWSEKERATRQLEYIHHLAQVESSWMQIVTSPLEARQAIRDGKLAIVLSLEMDRLTADEILELSRDFGVRHVIPVHLMNNDFGGAALYSDLFEASQIYVNGSTFETAPSPAVSFRFPEEAMALVPAPLGAARPSVIMPGDDSRHTGRFGCFSGSGDGHVNALGLRPGARDELKRLMNAGLMIDLSHMSENSINGTLDLAEEEGHYPLMNSHTGIRTGASVTLPEAARKHHPISEREMTWEQLERLQALGGVIGLGTSGDANLRQVAKIYGGEIVRLGHPDGRAHTADFAWDLVDHTYFGGATRVTDLRIFLQTGGDDKVTNNAFDVVVTLRNGTSVVTSQIGRDVLFDNHTWFGWQDLTQLPAGTTLGDIESVQIRLSKFDGWKDNDEWKITRVLVEWQDPDGRFRPLVQKTASITEDHDGHFLRLKKDQDSWTQYIRWPASEAEGPTFRHLDVTLGTGSDDFENDEEARLVVELANRCVKDHRILEHANANSVATYRFTFDPPARPADIHRLYVQTLGTGEEGKCSYGSTSDLLRIPFLGSVLGFSYRWGLFNSGCFTQDNWDIDFAHAVARDDGETPVYVFSEHAGHPWSRLTGHRTGAVIYEQDPGCGKPGLDDSAELVHVSILTGKDGLKRESFPLVQILNPEAQVLGSKYINPPAADVWEGSGASTVADRGETIALYISLPPGTKVRDLGSVRILGQLQQGTHHDDWDIDSLTVSVVEDPMEVFNETYRVALSKLGGRGVALGTDLNGLQHQIAGTVTSATTDGAGNVLVLSPYGNVIDVIPPSVGTDGTSGSPLSLRSDGLAHYGMLAEFASALRNVPDHGSDSADRLFRTAEDVIRMWERLEAVRAGSINGSTSERCSAWAPHGAAQIIEPGKCYLIGPNLPDWWGSQMVQVQLTDSSLAPVTLSTESACSDQVVDVRFTAAWEQKGLQNASVECPLVVQIRSESSGTSTAVHY